MTNAEARFNNSLRPRKPEGSLGRTAQEGHLDFNTAPELCVTYCKFNVALRPRRRFNPKKGSVSVHIISLSPEIGLSPRIDLCLEIGLSLQARTDRSQSKDSLNPEIGLSSKIGFIPQY